MTGGGVDGRGGGEGSGRVVGVREDVLAAVLEDMEVDDGGTRTTEDEVEEAVMEEEEEADETIIVKLLNVEYSRSQTRVYA